MTWMICINNHGYEASLESRKLYAHLNDDKAKKLGMVRVVDESGEDYLYPNSMFTPIPVSHEIEGMLLAA